MYLGLDSYNARTVIGALKYLSNPNKTTDDTLNPATTGMELMTNNESNGEKLAKAIICTIHQPTSEIFQCFSHIILLYHGRCVFQGQSQDAIAHFSKLVSVNKLNFCAKIKSKFKTIVYLIVLDWDLICQEVSIQLIFI